MTHQYDREARQHLRSTQCMQYAALSTSNSFTMVDWDLKNYVRPSANRDVEDLNSPTKVQHLDVLEHNICTSPTLEEEDGPSLSEFALYMELEG